ncbi:sulfatase-like hydrolase/transferase [Agaribacterium sp. ZY112]|uniref:sulfatase-like hydrolase/transferase n=1 Tax=Agaribacterium sp. ZY112 TaxID=3233574 RepID=UPI003525FF52
MHHHRFIALLSFVCSLSLISACNKETTPEPLTTKANNKPLNIVLILIDDLSHYGVSIYGANAVSENSGLFSKQSISTPNIDELAQEGFVAAHAYSYPLCENTRVALMSGKFNKRNYLKPKSLHHSEVTFSDIFAKAGYKTGLFGKWKQSRGTRDLPGLSYISEFGWQDYVAYDVISDTQRFINPRLVINGETHDYRGRTDLDPKTGRRWYGPDIINRHALRFIEENKNKPFFLYYPMLLVHDDHKPTPDTRPKTLFDEVDEVHHNRNGHQGDDFRYFPDMISYMDKLIGRVINKLEQEQLLDNTMVVILGDNGTKEVFTHHLNSGQDYPARKGGNTDNGIHIPLVISHPQAKASKGLSSQFYQGLVHVVDILPTLVDAAGIELETNGDIDGISLMPQILGSNDSLRSSLHHWYIGNSDYRKQPSAVEYAFDQNFKRYAPSQHFPKGRFFDLRSDALEQQGDTVKEFRWGVLRYSGLDLKQLSEEQKQAYNDLGKVLEANAFVDIQALSITATQKHLSVGHTLQLHVQRKPCNVTRNAIVWRSSDKNIATVDKFGLVTALKPGQVTIHSFSWSDASPLADGGLAYTSHGVSDLIQLSIGE